MNFNLKKAKYDIEITSRFKNDYKKIRKQNKDITKLIKVLEILSEGKKLAPKYKNHKLINDNTIMNVI